MNMLKKMATTIMMLCIGMMLFPMSAKAEETNTLTFSYAYDVQRGGDGGGYSLPMTLSSIENPEGVNDSYRDSPDGSWQLTYVSEYGDSNTELDAVKSDIFLTFVKNFSNDAPNNVPIWKLSEGATEYYYGVIVARDTNDSNCSQAVFIAFDQNHMRDYGYYLSKEAVDSKTWISIDSGNNFVKSNENDEEITPPTSTDPTTQVTPPTTTTTETAPAEAPAQQQEEAEPEVVAYIPAMKTTNVNGTQLEGWTAIENAIPTLTQDKQQDVNGANKDLLHIDVSGFNKTIPASVIKVTDKATSITGLHVFIGNSDAITFLAKNDLSGYQETNFDHKDTITEHSRTIEFIHKQDLGTTVMFHTTVPVKSTRVTIYKVDADNNRTRIGRTSSNANGQVCFGMKETGTYVLEY